MSLVRGPIELKSDRQRVCDYCGKIIEEGDMFFLARVNGKGMHVCSKRCFHFRRKDIELASGDYVGNRGKKN